MRDMKGQAQVAQLVPLAIIPIALVLGIIIFGATNDTLRQTDTFRGWATNETLSGGPLNASGTAVTSLSVVNPFVDYNNIVLTKRNLMVGSGGNATVVPRNGSATCTATSQDCYTIERQGTSNFDTIRLYSRPSNASYDVNGTYQHFAGGGIIGSGAATSLTAIGTNSTGGFNLAGILPIIIAGVIIVGVVLGALAFRRQ